MFHSWSHKNTISCIDPPYPKPMLTALPLELIEEILKLLDLQTILRLRRVCKSYSTIKSILFSDLLKTCRLLRAASKSRQLWHELIGELQVQPGISPTEEPLHDYTVEELEHWVLRRHRVRAAWASPHGPVFWRRSFNAYLVCPLVLPGGRWLLSKGDYGRLLFADLDAMQPTMKVLCDYIDQGEISGDPTCFTTWVDPTEARLTFRVAISRFNDATRRDGKIMPTRIYIFQVRLVGHGQQATLVAEPFQILEVAVPGFLHDDALDDHYLIQIRGNGHYYKNAVIHVFRYSSAAAGYPWPITAKMDMEGARDIHIIPHDRIVVTRGTGIAIYALPKLPDVGSHSQLTALHILDFVLCPGRPLHAIHSPFHHGPRFTSAVYLDVNSLAIVQVPNDPLQEPHIFRLTTDFWPGNTTAIGHRHANIIRPRRYFNNCRGCLDTLTYSLDSESGDEPITRLVLTRRSSGFPLCHPRITYTRGFDEGTGRLVCVASGDQVEVYDTVY